MLLLEHSVEYTELGDGLHYILRISVSFLLLLSQLLYSVFLFEKKKKEIKLVAIQDRILLCNLKQIRLFESKPLAPHMAYS